MTKIKYKPFDLEKAKAGAKVMTRAGDRVVLSTFHSRKIVDAPIEGYVEIDGFGFGANWRNDGRWRGATEDDLCEKHDLVMCPEESESKTIVLTKEEANAISVAVGFVQVCALSIKGETAESLARLAASLSEIRDKYDKQFEEE